MILVGQYDSPVTRRIAIARDPQADDADRIGVQERRVLMPVDLAADQGLLEQIHRLQQQRRFDTERACERRQPRLAREAVEHRIEIVQRMADLVQGPRHGLVRRLLLEEETDGATRLAEIGVARMALVLLGPSIGPKQL